MRTIFNLCLFFFGVLSFAQLDESKLPPSGISVPIKFDEPEHFKLKNGLKVYFLKDTISGFSHFSFYHDQPPRAYGELTGVSELMSKVLQSSGTRKNRKNVLEEMEYYAADISFLEHSASISCLTRFTPQVLKLFSQVIFAPRWNSTKLDNERNQMIETLKANESNPSAVAKRLRRSLAYGKHPYGAFPTIETLKNVSIDDVEQLHRQSFVTENSLLLVSGNFSFDEVQELVKKYFKKKSKNKENPLVIDKAKGISESFIGFVDMPEAVQSQIGVVYPVDIQRSHPDYLALQAANVVLGNSFDSRLNMKLREERGFTYGARGKIFVDRHQSVFSASSKVRNEITDSALTDMISEIKSFQTRPITKEELKNAKAKLKGNFIRSFEDSNLPLSMQMDIVLEGVSREFFINYLENVDALSLEEVNAVAKKYFRTDKAAFVVVGKEDEIITKIERLGYPIRRFDIYVNALE